MTELVFLKLGGSLITEKNRRFAIRREVLTRLVTEIAAARAAWPELQLVIGHGSGSFGHVAAQEHGFDPARGHSSPGGFAAISAAAAALNAIVRACLLDARIPAISLPPSASAIVENGTIVDLALAPYERLLAWGAVPLTYGDVTVCADRTNGSILSTEAVFHYLATHLNPNRLILLGQVEGVYAADPRMQRGLPPVIPEITPGNWEKVQAVLGGSHGADVTGGMRGKVAEMLALARAVPGLTIRVASGMRPGLVEQLLLNRAPSAGTAIHA
ncbi:MAG TPA: uridylate kinase [Chloroflexi bacterium]|nr:uridylate kinase [Chloroflexota bacterium]